MSCVTISPDVHVAASFTYPFRAGAAGAWRAGVPLVLLLPFSLPLLLGYAARVTRAVRAAPGAPPPGLRPDRRLVGDGLLLTVAAALGTAPIAALLAVLGAWLRPRVPAADPLLGGAEAYLLAAGITALPAGVAALAVGLPAFAAYCDSGRARDLLDARAALRLVRHRFVAWNLAGVAIVTAWAIALAGAGLLCAGFLPGAFYAILVSAHAAASLTTLPGPAPREAIAEAAPAG